MKVSEKRVEIAERYYQAMARKKANELEPYLASDVEFVTPLVKLKGKEALLQAAEGFFSVFKTLTIREKFGNEDKAIIIYELDCPMPIGIIQSVALISFEGERISHIKLYYDPRPFVK